jgi:hypothetical protein
MEIPLDLERRLERRWVARTKHIALKGCINRMPRPASLASEKPAINGLGSVKQPRLFRAARSATARKRVL